MSGGVGPTGDILLKEEANHQHPNQQQPQHKPYLHRSIFSFQQLNSLAIVIVLSASGMVAALDLAFVVFSFFYMYFLSKVAFPTVSPTHKTTVFDSNNRLIRLYTVVGAAAGLFLPVAYIFEGVLEGDKEGIKAATPHVFLLASQYFLEEVAGSFGFSLPMRMLVMVVYNSTRIFALMEWVRCEVMKVGEDLHGSSSSRRLLMGRVLAVVNLVYWGFHLFGFLLPFYLPKAFKIYYSTPKINLKD